MSTPVRLSRQSLADRDRIVEFLTESSLPAAERVMSVLSRTLEDIAALPRIGRSGPHGYRKLIVRFGNAGYEIRYRLYPDRAVITPFFHTREDR